MLKQKLQEELRKSMLAKDTLKTSVLRMLLSAINYYEIKKGGARYEATDEDVFSVIQKEVKQRRDSIEQFQKGGRQDLVDKEKKELEMLQKYLPASLFTPLVPHHQKRSGVEDRRISTTCNTN